MNFNWATKIDQPEWMDTQTFPQSIMNEALWFLRFTNTHFGGHAVVLKYLNQWSANWPAGQELSILDVGTGLADVPLAIAHWAKKNDKRVTIAAIDIVPAIVQAARRHVQDHPNIHVYQSDVHDVLKDNQRFDYVVASLFLHHVPPHQQIETIRLLDHAAKKGLIISDLYRSALGYLSVTAASTLWGNFVVRHDGPLSVRRAFTSQELHELSRKAQLDYLTVQREPWFRISLSGEKIGSR